MASLSSSMTLSTPFVRCPPPEPSSRAAAFGVNLRRGRVTAMAAYKVKLLTPEGPAEFECPDDVYVLDAAEQAGIDLPYSCRSGSCSSCAGKVVEGEVDQSENSFLDEEQLKEGYVLTCIALPRSDLVVQTHKEGAVA